MSTSAVLTVAVYARASRDPSERRVSVDRQIARCSALAESLFAGARPVVFRDDAISGFDPGAVRPGYDDFLAAIRRGDVQAVVVHEQSRLTRQPGQWEDLVVTLSRAGITQVHTVQSGVIDVGGSKLIGRILAAVDAEEAERAKARIRAAHEQLRAEGRPGTGSAGYGYHRVVGPDGRPAFEIDPEEADAVRRISDLVCDGHSLVSIAKALNDARILAPKRKGLWTASTLRVLLRRPSLAGLRSRTVRDRDPSPDGTGRVAVNQHEEIVGVARWDPILSEARWRQTLDALGALTVTGKDGKQRMVNRKQGPRPRRWLLSGSSGLGRCGVCGGPLNVGLLGGYSTSAGTPAYACRTAGCLKVMITPAAAVEAWAHGQLVAYLSTKAAQIVTAMDTDNPERDELEEERRKAKRVMDEADEMFAAGEIDRARHRAISGTAKDRFRRVQKAIDALPVPESDIPDLETIRDRWKDLPLARQRRALAYFANAVIVEPSHGRRAVDVTARIGARVRIDWKDLNPPPVPRKRARRR